jgi:hypothetical protein
LKQVDALSAALFSIVLEKVIRNSETNTNGKPIPGAARSKAWVYGRSLAGIVGSNPAGGMDICLC